MGVPRRRILVITGEVLGARMAGPAIRALHIARELSSAHDVTLVTTERCELHEPQVRCMRVDERELVDVGGKSDVVIVQGDALTRAPELGDSDAVIVVDLYDPFHLEVLERTRTSDVAARRTAVAGAVDAINTQLRRGDFFLCASSRQRDFWLGALASIGRINECTYDLDPTLESLIAVVPFGMEDRPPVRTASAMRGVDPGIGPNDEILLWGGGIYEWFDPLSLIRAVDRLRRRRPGVRLVFAGAHHPNPHVGATEMSVRARSLADELELTNRYVFFHDWIDFDLRQNYLLEADIGVSTHLDHIETAFSFRTRVLDYLWAGLPIITTAGDALADIVTEAGAGIAVPPGDVAAIEGALWSMLDDAPARASAAVAATVVATSYRWSLVLAPLVEFCDSPRRSPDLLDRSVRDFIRSRPRSRVRALDTLRRALAHAVRGEWSDLLAKGAKWLRRTR